MLTLNAVLEENRRLRAALLSMRRQFSGAPAGEYLLLDDGTLDGPHEDIEQAAQDCADEGCACTIIRVGARHEPESSDLADYYGLRPGVDFPASLAPSALLRGA